MRYSFSPLYFICVLYFLFYLFYLKGNTPGQFLQYDFVCFVVILRTYFCKRNHLFTEDFEILTIVQLQSNVWPVTLMIKPQLKHQNQQKAEWWILLIKCILLSVIKFSCTTIIKVFGTLQSSISILLSFLRKCKLFATK